MVALRIILAVLVLLVGYWAFEYHVLHREGGILGGAVIAFFGFLLLALYGVARLITWRLHIRRSKVRGFPVVDQSHQHEA